MIGYDLDGVLIHRATGTPKIRPQPEGSMVIVTNRPMKRARETLDALARIGIRCPVFFTGRLLRDGSYDFRGHEERKAIIVEALRLDEFWEDNPKVAAAIQRRCPHIKLHMVPLTGEDHPNPYPKDGAP